MKLYEGFFILPPDAAGDAKKNQMISLENTIQKFGGKVHQRHEIGKRPLGYAMKRFREGYMISLDFEIAPDSQESLRKTFELQEDILNFMMTVKDPKKEAAAKAARAARKAPAVAVAPVAAHSSKATAS